MAERGLGPLGRRLLVAFVVVAMSSVAVLTLAALIGTSRGLSASEDAQRQAAAASVAAATAEAYSAAGGWAGVDLSRSEAISAAAGARLSVRDQTGVPVAVPGMPTMSNGGMGPGNGPGSGSGTGAAGKGAVTESVVVAGAPVGSVRLAFGSPATSNAQQIAWTWILVAAAAALVVAVIVAWFVTRRISAPLVRVAGVARTFAAGDRSVRAAQVDVAAPGELGELARSFDATADAVVRSEQVRRSMAADIAHELRTPLAALQAGLEELQDGLVAPEPERLASLHAQSVRLGRIVDDLSELSAAETAALSQHRSRLDLSSVLAAAVQSADPAMDAAGLLVQTEIEPAVTVEGDAGRLHQAFGNLLANVVRYCRPGDQVTVTLTAEGAVAVVVIADSGPGIPAAELPHVFERLWRGTADSDEAGLGIGLAIVREVVTAHGGTVAAESDGSSGTSFSLRLPLASGAV